MKFQLTINLPMNASDLCDSKELVRILRELAESIEISDSINFIDAEVLRDIDGYKIGRWEVIKP